MNIPTSERNPTTRAYRPTNVRRDLETVDQRLVVRHRLATLAGFLRERHQHDLALAADHLAEALGGLR